MPADLTEVSALLPAATDARIVALASRRDWQTLLFMRPRWWGAARSVVDSPEFFLSAAAAWTPERELAATVAAFAQPFDAASDAHPLCRFPARAAWLAAAAPDLSRLWDTQRPACKALRQFLAGTGDERASLVFSSAFANNPASLFGHLFLRLHKRAVAGRTASPLLDDTVNFMAEPDTSNPLLYTWRGATGGFAGRFSLLPFYLKIQEYNNAESRDLWDYELALSRAELQRLKLVLWDVGPQTIDYWYFDENCSLILLMLIEAAKPDIVLQMPHPWVIPADAVRVVTAVPGLVSAVHFRPSVRTRFLRRYALLDPSHQALLTAIIADNAADTAAGQLMALAPAARAAVIDTAIEFIDYDEELAGTKAATVHASLRRSLLAERARLITPSSELNIPAPDAERPDRAAGSARIGLGAVHRFGALPDWQLSWRPALRSLAEPDWGRPTGLAIAFFDTLLRWQNDNKKLFIERFNLLSVLSVPPAQRLAKALAWSVELGAARSDDCSIERSACSDYHGRVGVGPTLSFGALTLYGLAKTASGWEDFAAGTVYAGPALGLGLSAALSARAKLTAYGEVGRRFQTGGRWHRQQQWRIDGLRLGTDDWEYGVSCERRAGPIEVALSVYRFY